jgi:hypothetical protein
MAFVSIDGMQLEFVKKQNFDICVTAIKQNINSIKFIKLKSPQLILEIVKVDGLLLKDLIIEVNKDDRILYDKICTKAVLQNGLALKYIKSQTFDMCIAAVKNNGKAIKYINLKLSDDIMEYLSEIAIKQNPLTLKYIKKQTINLSSMAITSDGLALKYVNDKYKTEEICIAAVMTTSAAINYINDPHMLVSVIVRLLANFDLFTIDKKI